MRASTLDAVRRHPIDRVADQRGELVRHYDSELAETLGMRQPRQVLRSHTAQRHTLRGLHCQVSPHCEAKLIIPMTGRMFWVVIDLKRSSPSFGQWRSFHLGDDQPEPLFVPRGCGHGCLSMTDDVSLLIIADNDFSADDGFGIAWNDPELAIVWPLDGKQPLISDAHAAFPSFASFQKAPGGL